MLTEEQIKNLKPGDPLVIHGTFDSHSPFGNIIIKHREQMLSGISEKSLVYVHPSAVSLPSEHGTSLSRRSSEGAETEVPTTKYDPCRLFRKGDRVKTRSVFGRKIYIDDVLYEVMWDESCNKISVKDLTSAETLVGMPSVFFELVIPVEEMEPYFVIKGDLINGWDVCKQKNENICCTVATFTQGHPNAKAAAEAERDRLNDEWRKEQK